MDLTAYSNQTRQLNRLTVTRILLLLRPTRNVVISLDTLRLLAQALYPTVRDSRKAAEQLAAEFFSTTSGADTKPRQSRSYTADNLFLGLKTAFRGELGDTQNEHTFANNVARRKLIGAVTKHVEDAGRRQTIALTYVKSNRALGWARYDPEPPSCAFCLTMISRGPVYSTAEDAGEQNDWHPFCTCKVVAVFDRNNWPGRDQFLEAEKTYKEATKKYGTSINAVRAYLGGYEPLDYPGKPESSARSAA